MLQRFQLTGRIERFLHCTKNIMVNIFPSHFIEFHRDFWCCYASFINSQVSIKYFLLCVLNERHHFFKCIKCFNISCTFPYLQPIPRSFFSSFLKHKWFINSTGKQLITEYILFRLKEAIFSSCYWRGFKHGNTFRLRTINKQSNPKV